MSQFVVVYQDESSFTQCIAVKENYESAVCEAYTFASNKMKDYDTDKFVVTPLFELEGDTGVGFRFGENVPIKTMFILINESIEDSNNC